MKKLKIKVFTIILIMQTMFTLSISAILNYQVYRRENKAMKDIIEKTVTLYESQEIKIENLYDVQRVYVDSIVYTIVLDQNNNMKYIISHTENKTNAEKILSYANEILNKKTTQEINIGNLYSTDYSYAKKDEKYIIIVDNTSTKIRLNSLSKITMIIALISEIIITIISFKLTEWATKPVEETFNKQKQFIEDAAHELKTPLAVIMANADNLEMDEKNDKWIYNIKTESERMNKLIIRLLTLAKLEHKKEQTYSKVDLSKTVEMSVLTFESLIYEKNIKLQYNIAEDIQFKCNPDDIKQIMSIFMDNAIEHSYEENGEIIVTLEKDKNDIILKVKNKGNPIPKEEQKRIFERFYRSDESRNRDTNHYGLGLAIAKNIVTIYGGDISVYNENEYTTFKVRFKQEK